MRRFSGLWVAIALAAASWGPCLAQAAPTDSAAATLYAVTPLGALSPEIPSIGTAINNRGEVVGYSWNGQHVHSFLYANGVMTDLGSLGGDLDNRAYGINDAGQVVGCLLVGSTDLRLHAFVWSAGTVVDLNTASSQASCAYAINNAGRVTGYTEIDRVRRAFLYSDGVMTDLGVLGRDPANSSAGAAVNDADHVAGSSDKNRAVGRGFVHAEGTMTEVAALCARCGSPATGINHLNQVVGSLQVRSATTLFHAYVSTGGTVTDLGTLGGASSFAYGINASGHIVGRSQRADRSWAGFVFKDGQMIDLNTVLDPASGAGWTISNYATDTFVGPHGGAAINDTGQIVAVGRNSLTGYLGAVLLTPLPGASRP